MTVVPLKLFPLISPFKINMKTAERLEDKFISEIDIIFISKTKL